MAYLAPLTTVADFEAEAPEPRRAGLTLRCLLGLRLRLRLLGEAGTGEGPKDSNHLQASITANPPPKEAWL